MFEQEQQDFISDMKAQLNIISSRGTPASSIPTTGPIVPGGLGKLKKKKTVDLSPINATTSNGKKVADLMQATQSPSAATQQ